MGLTLTIELPDLDQCRDEISRRWEEVCADDNYHQFDGRVETDRYGRVLLNPPPGYIHGYRANRIARLLEGLLGPVVIVECPVLTVDGVKAADVAHYLPDDFRSLGEGSLPHLPPQICVEVLSSSNRPSEIAEKIAADLAAGVREVWVCDTDESLTFFEQPEVEMTSSALCPSFPSKLPAE